MHRRISIPLLTAVALATWTVPAGADEIGSAGFTVPQNEWLWGIEGLVRTPVDASLDFGGMFIGYEVNGRAVHDDTADSMGIAAVSDRLDIEPEGIQGGFRLAGGIGYWNCCVLFEPAIQFRMNRALGDEKSDETPNVFDLSDPDEFEFADADYQNGWDLMVGPQMTWMVPKDGLLGGIFGGKPLVFFPYLGVTHIDWDAELVFRDNGILQAALDRNYEEDNLLVGFDLDLPLPGSHWSFTHFLTFSFQWNTGSDDDHDFGPFGSDLNPIGPFAGSNCSGGGNDTVCFNLNPAEGWKIGLLYRVTWNDFEGFFKRVVFGPVN